MPYVLTYDEGSNIAEMTFTGSMVRDDINESTREGTELQKRTGVTRFLLDMRQAELRVAHSDVFELPAVKYWVLDRRTRIAVIQPDSERGREAVIFYRDACQNRGWNTRIFSDRESAIQWLVALT